MRFLSWIVLLLFLTNLALAEPVQFSGFESTDTEDIQSASGSNVVDCTTTTPSWPVRTGICSGRISTTTSGTGNFRIGAINQAGGRYTASLHEDTICTTFHFRVNTAPATNNEEILVDLDTTGTATKGSVRINSSRKLQLYDSTGTLLATGTATIPLDSWSRIEAKLCTGTSCTSTVYVDGVSDISASGNFLATQHGSVRLGKVNNNNSNAVTYYYDDILLDNSSCIGNIRVKRVPIDEEGDLQQWEDGTGVDEYPQVSDFPPGDTTTYIKNPGSGFPEFSTFGVGSDTGDAPSGAIRSVKVHAYARQDPTASGDSAFGLLIRNNEFEYASGTNILNASSSDVEARALLRNVDPYTGASWQPEGVQAMQIGVFENNAVKDRVFQIMAMVAYDETSVIATPTPAPTYIPNTPISNFISSYPTASGYGIDAPVGSGRHSAPTPAPGAYGTVSVIKITNLNDTGTGSFRDCVETQSGPRTCIFEISGYIDLESDVNITNPYLTVAGQTAPEPGVHLRNSRINIKTHDILFQNFSIRPGEGFPGTRVTERDAVVIDSSSGNPVYNVHLNKMSLAYGLDEILSSYAGSVTKYPIDNINVSETIIAQGLNNSVRGTYYRGCNSAVCSANPSYCTEYCTSPPCGQCTDYKVPHGKAIILDPMTRTSFHENLVAMSEDRHARIKPGIELEFFNNYVYGWAGDSTWQMMNCSGTAGSAACKLSIAGNYYRKAPYSQIAPILYYDTTVPILSRAYMSHNICPTRPLDVSNEWLCSNWPSGWQVFSPPFTESGVQVKLPNDTVTYTLTNAGARTWSRWIGDQQVVDDVVAGGGEIKDCITGCDAAVFPDGWPTITPTVRELTPPPVPNYIESNGRSAIENFIFSFNSDGNQHYTPEPTANPSAPTATPTNTSIPTRTPLPTFTPTPDCS